MKLKSITSLLLLSSIFSIANTQTDSLENKYFNCVPYPPSTKGYSFPSKNKKNKSIDNLLYLATDTIKSLEFEKSNTKKSRNKIQIFETNCKIIVTLQGCIDKFSFGTKNLSLKITKTKDKRNKRFKQILKKYNKITHEYNKTIIIENKHEKSFQEITYIRNNQVKIIQEFKESKNELSFALYFKGYHYLFELVDVDVKTENISDLEYWGFLQSFFKGPYSPSSSILIKLDEDKIIPINKVEKIEYL